LTSPTMTERLLAIASSVPGVYPPEPKRSFRSPKYISTAKIVRPTTL
jgi:hypothetical protein